MPGGPRATGLLPKIALPEPVGLGKRRRRRAEAPPSPGRGPGGREKERGALCTNRSRQSASRPIVGTDPLRPPSCSGEGRG